MKKPALMVIALAMLLFVGTAQAAPTPQQNCDYARITAWKVYQACVENVVAKDAKGIIFDEFAAFARCRHAYFSKWNRFQSKASLAGSTCIGTRFTDNGDETVMDNLSGLVWEKKGNFDGVTNFGDPHDADNYYTWSSSGPSVESGTIFTNFLAALNSGAGFAGLSGWRLPTLTELQTIVLDFACKGAGGDATCVCLSQPCIDAAFGPTQANAHWSSTSYAPAVSLAWSVDFLPVPVFPSGGDFKTGNTFVRAACRGL